MPEAVPGVEAIVAWLEKAGYAGKGTPAGDARAAPLRRYWTHGEGAAKIRWGEPGDFDRCVREVSKHMPGRAEGYCFISSTPVLPARSVVALSELASNTHGQFAPALAGARRNLFGTELRGAYDRYYVGEIVVLRVASGHEASVTPNHPIATVQGWVPASRLRVGDDVLCSTGREWEMGAVVDPYVDDVPPTIEQVAKSLPFGHVAMSRREDFHGDGAGSEVYQFRSNPSLLADSQTAVPKPSRELVLSHRDVARRSDRSAGTANLDAGISKYTTDSLSADLEVAGDLDSGLSALIARYDFLFNVGPTYSRHSIAKSVISNPVVEGFGRTIQALCDRGRSLSLAVAPQQIVSVQRQRYVGHVYNLDTTDGWYVASSIIAQNCNLRHKEALGYYPATHARMERAGTSKIRKEEEASLDLVRSIQGRPWYFQIQKAAEEWAKKSQVLGVGPSGATEELVAQFLQTAKGRQLLRSHPEASKLLLAKAEVPPVDALQDWLSRVSVRKSETGLVEVQKDWAKWRLEHPYAPHPRGKRGATAKKTPSLASGTKKLSQERLKKLHEGLLAGYTAFQASQYGDAYRQVKSFHDELDAIGNQLGAPGSNPGGSGFLNLVVSAAQHAQMALPLIQRLVENPQLHELAQQAGAHLISAQQFINAAMQLFQHVAPLLKEEEVR
jgi:hypothetical protein